MPKNQPEEEIVLENTEPKPLVMFSEWLAEYKGGSVDEELTSKLSELVQIIDQRGKKGSITFTLNLGKNGERALELTEKVAVKLPPDSRSSAIFYPDEQGGLFRDDPFQVRAGYRRLT